MDKKQNNKNTYCHRCDTQPIKVGVYMNGASGNLFTGKPCMTAENRIKPKSVYLDDDGLVCIEI